MGIHTLKIEPHWNYLLAVERDVEKISRYVEFDPKNFECFSIELARLLLACGAEIDVVCKQICRALNQNSRAESIGKYKTEIVAAYPDVPTFEVQIPRFGLVLHPWDEWRKPKGQPLWWTAYNKTKHQRDSEYHRANLKNTLNAVAGLFVMVLYLYRRKATIGELVPATQLLRVSGEHYGGSTQGYYELGINYAI